MIYSIFFVQWVLDFVMYIYIFLSSYLSSCSSFCDHFGYKLSKAEVDILSKRKWKYKWVVPAFDIPNCKWIGIGECFIKVLIYLIFVLYINSCLSICLANLFFIIKEPINNCFMWVLKGHLPCIYSVYYGCLVFSVSGLLPNMVVSGWGYRESR